MIINNSYRTAHYLWTKRSKMQQVVTACWLNSTNNEMQHSTVQACQHNVVHTCWQVLTGCAFLRMYAGLENCGQRLYISYPSRCWQRNFNPSDEPKEILFVTWKNTPLLSTSNNISWTLMVIWWLTVLVYITLWLRLHLSKNIRIHCFLFSWGWKTMWIRILLL